MISRTGAPGLISDATLIVVEQPVTSSVYVTSYVPAGNPVISYGNATAAADPEDGPVQFTVTGLAEDPLTSISPSVPLQTVGSVGTVEIVGEGFTVTVIASANTCVQAVALASATFVRL